MVRTARDWEEPEEDPAFTRLKERILDTDMLKRHAPQVIKRLEEKAPNGEGALVLVNIY